MKNILSLILILITLFSCSNESKIKESISKNIKEHLKNPDSFEFVSMKIISKISLDTLKGRVDLKKLNEFRELVKNRDSEENKDFLLRIQKEYDFIQKYKGDKNEAEYYVEFVAKGTNSYGAIIQSSYEAQVLNDEDKTTLSVTELEK